MAQVKVDRAATAGMTNKERRAYVREQARIERERLARERRTRRAFGWTIAGLAVVATAVIASLAITNSIRESEKGPANMLSDGLLLTGTSGGSTMNPTTTAALAAGALPVANASTISTTGVLDIRVYLDPTSKDSATFWSAIGSTLESDVEQGYISLELHPIAMSTSDSDAVAAVAAFGCVADGDSSDAAAMWDAMLQVSIAGLKSGHYLTAADLSKAASTAGVTDSSVLDCISRGGFTSWAKAASERAKDAVPGTTAGGGVTKTPYVVAAGSVYTGKISDTTAFTTFLGDAYTAATKTTTHATPSPSPSATP